MPGWLRQGTLLILGVILILMPFHAFLSTWGGTAIGPLELWKSWKELLLIVSVLLVIAWIISKPEVLKLICRDPLVITITAYVLLTLVLAGAFLEQNGRDATLAGLAMNLRYLAVASLAYLLFRFGRSSPRWIVRGAWCVLIVGVFVALLGLLQVLILPNNALEAFGYNKDTTIAPVSTIDNDPDFLRAFATLRGPNDFGAFLILPILFTIANLRRFPKWVSATTLTFLVVALLASGSRSALLGALVAVLIYVAIQNRARLSTRIIALVLGSVVLLGVGTVYAATQSATLQRFVFKSSPGDSSLLEGSTANHLTAKIQGVERFVSNPLGCGPGCAGPASYYGDNPKISENYLIQIGEETGYLGLTLFLCIVVLTANKLYVAARMKQLSQVLLAALGGYAVIGMLLHVWTDDPLSITWWLLAGALIGYNESEAWIKSKSSSRYKT